MATAAPRRHVVPAAPRRSQGYRPRVALALCLALLASLLTMVVPPIVSPSTTPQAIAGDPVTTNQYYDFQVAASPNPATAGGTVTWTFSITNKMGSNRLVAPTTSINVSTLPAGCALTRGNGWSSEGGVYYIPAGATGTYTCTTSAPAATTTYSIPTVANGTSSGMRAATYNCGVFSCSWSYNPTQLGSVIATETLLLGPDLTVTKTASKPSVVVGETVTYTIMNRPEFPGGC